METVLKVIVFIALISFIVWGFIPVKPKRKRNRRRNANRLKHWKPGEYQRWKEGIEAGN